MATKKTTTKPKYYVVMDEYGDIFTQGEWNEIKEEIEMNIAGGHNESAKNFVNSLTIHELTAGKKLKYIPAVPASIEL
jgi:hypothetical protein